MLLRTPLCAAGALLIAASASAQQTDSAQLLPANTAKDAGVYHLATGTWTRAKSPAAMLGTDILYDNTCTTGYYVGYSAGEYPVDAGRLPSTTSPASGISLTGSANSYLIDGFQLGYCTHEATEAGTVNFYQCYEVCVNDATALTPDQSFTLAALPGTGTGSFACWNVTIDLSLTSQGFNLNADCDGTYDGIASLDNFGWSLNLGTPLNGGHGSMTAGDALFAFPTGSHTQACAYGDGTYWSTTGQTVGTGIATGDSYQKIDGTGASVGCYFLGGYPTNPYSSFYLEIYGNAAAGPVQTGTQYCNADGGGAICPCGNNNDGSNGTAGCANGVNTGGCSLDAVGTPSASNDTVVFTASGSQPNQFGVFFRADNSISIAFGDGLRCAGGNINRLELVNSGATGTVSSSVAMLAGLVAGDVKRFQYWYRNPLNSPCGGTFNLSNGYEITVAP